MDKHIDQGITGGKEVSDLPGGSVVNPCADMVAQPNKSGGEQGSGDGIDNIISNLQQQAEKRGACIKPELRVHLQVAKREIIDRIGWQDDPNQLILYPGSSSDRTMADVFGEQVVHIDPDGNALAWLQDKGLRTEQTTIEDYIAHMPDGEKINIILSYNAGLVPDSALELLSCEYDADDMQNIYMDIGLVLLRRCWRGCLKALKETQNSHLSLWEGCEKYLIQRNLLQKIRVQSRRC